MVLLIKNKQLTILHMDPNALIIYIDGSAITNPGQVVGCAGLVSYPDTDEADIELEWSYGFGTSGSMELSALVNAIKWINENIGVIRSHGVNKVIIASDNDTVVNGANSWVQTWYKNKWRKKDGSPVRNLDLWKLYIRERSKTRISLEVRWIKGKSNLKTKTVDKLAKKAAKAPSQNKLSETNLPSVGRSLTTNKIPANDYNGDASNALIRVYYHQFIKTKGDNLHEIRFETITNGKITGKYTAFASSEVDAQIDRGHFYLAEFEANSSFPKLIFVIEVEGNELENLREKLVENGYLKK